MQPSLTPQGFVDKWHQATLKERSAVWLNPPGASQTELKKRTLTNLYNQRPTWLDLTHRKLMRRLVSGSAMY